MQYALVRIERIFRATVKQEIYLRNGRRTRDVGCLYNTAQHDGISTWEFKSDDIPSRRILFEGDSTAGLRDNQFNEPQTKSTPVVHRCFLHFTDDYFSFHLGDTWPIIGNFDTGTLIQLRDGDSNVW